MISDLSRDPESSMLGFSREVAREVTHPEWPSRVPLRINCSVILAMWELLNRFVQIIEKLNILLRGRLSDRTLVPTPLAQKWAEERNCTVHSFEREGEKQGVN